VPEGAARWPHVIVLDPFAAGLAIARRMSRLGAPVTMLLEPGDRFAARSNSAEKIVLDFDPDAWLGRLLEIAGEGRECVAVPATDRSCELLLRGAARLPESLRAFERPGAGHLALMDKEQADGVARRAGVPVPWTAQVREQAGLAAALGQAPWPCVVKPIFSHEWRARYGEQRAFRVSGAEEARAVLERPLRDGVGMLICQYVPGGDDDVEEAILVRLADGSYPVAFGCRKLRQNPPGFGATAVGESSLLAQTTALAKRVLEEAGFVGVAGVETKRHSETGERWFLEVNVRVPGQWSLGDTAGAEVTPRLIATLAGQPLGPQPALREGVRLVHPDADAQVLRIALAGVSAGERPGLALRMLRLYAGARDFGIVDRRDPGPGLAFAAELLRRRLAGLSGRLRPARVDAG
jgi:D-aspartate ligase